MMVSGRCVHAGTWPRHCILLNMMPLTTLYSLSVQPNVFAIAHSGQATNTSSWFLQSINSKAECSLLALHKYSVSHFVWITTESIPCHTSTPAKLIKLWWMRMRYMITSRSPLLRRGINISSAQISLKMTTPRAVLITPTFFYLF